MPATSTDASLGTAAPPREDAPSPAIMLVVDLDTGVVVAAPQATLAMLGLRRGDVVGQLVSSFVAEDEAAARSVGDLARGCFDAYEAERTILVPRGGAIRAAISVTRVAGRGERLGVWTIALPGEAGRSTAMLHPEVTRHLPSLVLTVDNDLRVDGVGRHPRLRSGAQDLVGRSLLSLVEPHDVGMLLSAAGTVMTTGEDVEVVVSARVGERRRSRVVLSAQDPIGLVVAVWPEYFAGQDAAEAEGLKGGSARRSGATAPTRRGRSRRAPLAAGSADNPISGGEPRAASTMWRVLATVRQADRALSAAEIASALGVSRPTAQRHLASLADEGLLEPDLAYGATGRPRNVYRPSTLVQAS